MRVAAAGRTDSLAAGNAAACGLGVVRVGVSRVLGSGWGVRGGRELGSRERLGVLKRAGRLGAGVRRVVGAGSGGWSRESGGAKVWEVGADGPWSLTWVRGPGLPDAAVRRHPRAP